MLLEVAPLSICFPRCTSFSLDISATPTFRHNDTIQRALFQISISSRCCPQRLPICLTHPPATLLAHSAFCLGTKSSPTGLSHVVPRAKRAVERFSGQKTRGLEAAWWALRHATPSSPLLTEMQPRIFMRAGRGGTKQTFRALLVQQGLMKSFWNERKFQISE